MALPILLSVPHAGLRIPPEVASLCRLSPEQIAHDGDEGARAIYNLASEVAALITTDVARAIVDVNRSEDDRRADGVVKTQTCWHEPVYAAFPSEALIETLLSKYYRPFHQQLSQRAGPDLLLAVDCHTMAAAGPPIGPDPGQHRPRVCLSHADGTCPDNWMAELQRCFKAEFGASVTINDPFTGGYITRSHATEMPWVQLELSRAPFRTDSEKSASVIRALQCWVNRVRRERPDRN